MFFLLKNCILLSKGIKILKICTFFISDTPKYIAGIEYQVISHEGRGYIFRGGVYFINNKNQQ